jgi:hypothetical protein
MERRQRLGKEREGSEWGQGVGAFMKGGQGEEAGRE